LRSQFKSVYFVYFGGPTDTAGGGPFQRSTAWYLKESPYLWARVNQQPPMHQLAVLSTGCLAFFHSAPDGVHRSPFLFAADHCTFFLFFFLFLAVFPGPDLTPAYLPCSLSYLHKYCTNFDTLFNIPTDTATLITSYPTDLATVLTTYSTKLINGLIRNWCIGGCWFTPAISLGLYGFGSTDKSQRPQKSSTCYRFLHSIVDKTALNSLRYI